MCHMVADTLEELHEMATQLGLRRWFQDQARYPHYDISLTKRRKALTLGAVEVNERQILTVAKKCQKNGILVILGSSEGDEG